MGQLLKKAREWVSSGWNSNDSGSNSLHNLDNRGSAHATPSSSALNEIERLPLDIFVQILKLLEPKEAATLTSVCKSWKLIVSDDKLWKYFLRNQQDHWLSTFFAETNLRYGFPLRPCPRGEPSFMHMYGERSKVPGAIIIDGGLGYCKFGWSKYDSPSIRLSTFAEFHNTGSSLEASVYHFFASVYQRMHVYPSTQPVIISTPIVNYGGGAEVSCHQYTKAMYATLFKMDVPAVCTVNHASLAMFSARRTWGILVNIGYFKTHIHPILNGEIRHRVHVVSSRLGGSQLTRYLDLQLRQRNINASSLYTVRSLKETLCYVALDYEAELLKDTEASCRVDSTGCFTLKEERFRTGEVLFQPQIAGINERGLHEAVVECIENCRAVKMKSGHDWFKTIVLAGGTARLPGLAERLRKELHNLLAPSISSGIRVIASPYGADAVWHGAKIVSNVASFILFTKIPSKSHEFVY